MITEKGKEYIARNFGVNNCYALEEVVPCTVYTEGAPNERVLDTSAILFLLVTEVADWVSTAAGKFTLADLIAANDGSYISMMESLGIEAYCIAGEPPVTPPVTPPTTPVTPPTVGLKDFEIVSPSVNCDSDKCYARFDLRNNSGSASAYIRVEIDGAPCYKRYVYILRGATKPQVMSTSITGLSSGYHNLTIVVGKITDTDTYTHRFFVGGLGIEPPVTAAAKMTAAEIVAELGKRGPIDTAAVSTTTGKDKWYLVHGEYGGTWLSYVATNFIKSISLDIDVRNPPTQAADITLKANHNVVNELDRSWVLARLDELPYEAVAAPPLPLTKAEFLSELKKRGEIDLSRVSTVPGDNKWFQLNGQVIYQLPRMKGALTIGRIPPTSTSHIQFLKEGKQVDIVEKSWALARLSELPYTVTPGITIATDKATCRVNDTIYLKGQYIGGNGLPVVGHNIRFHSFINSTRTQIGSKKTQANGMYVFPYVPMVAGSWEFEAFNDYTSPRVAVAVTAAPPTAPPVTPPVTPTEPSEAIKAWVVANYGDGTRVTGDSADKLSQALLASSLAPLPAGYTSADITQDVYRWTRDNVGYTVVVDICSWIKREKVENLTINHALYIFYTAKGWTDAANDYFNKITPRPERISGDLATQDNAIAVYYYSREWYDAGNDYSKCNLKG